MNLNDYCSKDDVREWLNLPHKIDGKVFNGPFVNFELRVF